LITSLSLHLFGNAGVAVAIGVGTFLILLFGEIVPKSLSLTFSERFALLAAHPLSWFAWMVRPFQRRLTWLAESLIALFGIHPVYEPPAPISDMEFRTMVEMGEGHGVIPGLCTGCGREECLCAERDAAMAEDADAARREILRGGP